jgi:hypothetical protein
VSGEGVLLDSVILIEPLQRCREGHAVSAASAITRAKVLSGFDPPMAGPARMLLDSFPLVVIDGPVADLAARAA